MHFKDPANNLHWLDSEDHISLLPSGSVAITDEEAAVIRQASQPVPSYRDLRAAAYPPIADYLDAVVKADSKAIQAYKDACLAVKAKYPKA